MDGIKAYNNYQIKNNNQNNSVQGNFNGGNAPAVSPLDDGAVNLVSQPLKEPFKITSYIIPAMMGIGECLGINLLVNALCGPIKPITTNSATKEITGGYTQSRMYRMTKPIDSMLNGIGSVIPRSVKEFADNFYKRVIRNTQDLRDKNPEIADAFDHGFTKVKAPLTFDPTAIEHFAGPMAEQLAKLDAVHAVKFGVNATLLEQMKQLGQDGFLAEKQEIEDKIKAVCKAIEEHPGELPKDLRLSAAKIRLLQDAEGTALSKLFKKSLLGLGQFVGGSPDNIALNGLMATVAMKNLIEAPKKQKLSTFLDDMMSWGSMIIICPFIGRRIAGISGFKHLGGMDKKFENRLNTDKSKFIQHQGKDIQGEIKKLTEELFNAPFFKEGAKKKELKQAIKALRAEAYKNCTTKQKILKTLGRIIGFGYEYGKTAKTTWTHTAWNFVKTSPGMVLRLVIITTIAGICEKPFKLLLSKAFGKPYSGSDDKAKNVKKVDIPHIATAPNSMQQFVNAVQKPNTPAVNNEPTSQPQQTQVKYIPSPYPNQTTNQAYNQALDRINRLEQHGHQVLQQVN